MQISDVSPNSPAAHAGLQNDDYIIEISGQNVQNMQYADVVEYIKAKKQEDDLQLLVADRQTLDWYRSRKLPIASQSVPKMTKMNNEPLSMSDVPMQVETFASAYGSGLSESMLILKPIFYLLIFLLSLV